MEKKEDVIDIWVLMLQKCNTIISFFSLRDRDNGTRKICSGPARFGTRWMTDEMESTSRIYVHESMTCPERFFTPFADLFSSSLFKCACEGTIVVLTKTCCNLQVVYRLPVSG